MAASPSPQCRRLTTGRPASITSARRPQPNKARQDTRLSVHVEGWIDLKDVLAGDQDVLGCDAQRNLFAGEHPERDRQHFVAVAVEEEGNRSQEDAAAIVRIELFLIAGTAVHTAIDAVADDDAVAEAPGDLDRGLRRKCGCIVERGHQYLSSCLRPEEFSEHSLDTDWIPAGIKPRRRYLRQLALQPFDDALDAIRHCRPDVTDVADNHRNHALARPVLQGEIAKCAPGNATGGEIVGGVQV